MDESPEKLSLGGADELRQMLNFSTEPTQSPAKNLLSDMHIPKGTAAATAGPAVPRNAIQSLGGFGPVLQEYSLTSEFKLVQQQRFAGVYVTMAQQLVWDGVIFVRQGIYQGGIFRFKIHIPVEYPCEVSPKVYFDSVVYHPQVDELTGEVNIKKYFPTWYPDKSRLWQVVKVIDEMFTSADLVEPLHSAAAKLYTEDQPAFETRVTECIALSKDDSAHAAASTISFDGLSGKHQHKVINAMLEWGAEGALDRKRMRKLAEQGQREPVVGPLNIRGHIRSVHGAGIETARLRLAEDGCRGWLSRLGADSDWGRRWCVIGLPATTLDETSDAKKSGGGSGADTGGALSNHSSPGGGGGGGGGSGSARSSPELGGTESSSEVDRFDPRFAVFSQYENETEESLLDEAGIWDIVSAYQPPTAEMRANNSFMVVTTDNTVHQFRAESEKVVRVWLDVIRLRCASNLKWRPS